MSGIILLQFNVETNIVRYFEKRIWNSTKNDFMEKNELCTFHENMIGFVVSVSKILEFLLTRLISFKVPPESLMNNKTETY